MKREEVKGTAGLVLAAGASTRMGRPKQLLPLGDRSLLDHVLRETLNSDLDLVILVLGHKAEEITEALKTDLSHPKLRITVNSDYREGISTSIIAGLRVVEEDYEHLMVILGDMPLITSSLINLLIRRFLASGAPLGAVKMKNRRSHPVIFARGLYPELHQLRGDRGAKDLFLRYHDQVLLIEPEEDYDDRDIDTLQDYRRLWLHPSSRGSSDGLRERPRNR